MDGNDINQVALLTLAEVEQDRARLAAEVELLRAMMLFDWEYYHTGLNEDEINFLFTSILPMKFKSISFQYLVYVDSKKIVDNNYIRYTCDDEEKGDACVYILLEDNYAQIILGDNDDDHPDAFACVLTRKRADAFIELIDSKRHPIGDAL